MGKNIVVCCDGTANEFAADRTNVVKLCYALVKDPGRQLVYYHPGIGTMAAPGFTTKLGSFFARTGGLVFGCGLQNDVRDAYVFIMNHYQPGDRLYLLGFSRGAYTVRVVAALLHMYGLAMPGNDALIPYAVRMLWAITGIRDVEGDKAKQYFRLAQGFRDTLSGSECPTHFLGVWDTVSSVGWIGSPVALPFSKRNPSVLTARHAVSIDEHRAFFRTNLLGSPPGTDIRQVWFPGVHCDIGGGYPEVESGLSKIALQWMAGEACTAGLLIDEERLQTVLGHRGGDYAPPDPTAKMHESLTMAWWPAEFVPNRYYDREHDRETWRINRFRRRSLGKAPVIHDSAWSIDPTYAAMLPSDAVKLSEKHWPGDRPNG